MDQQEINTLKLLEAIEKDDTQSQRDLAKKLGISLGLVNSLIKRIAKKGYFKITTVPKNRVKYILTPKGFSEKIALTYRYISYSINFYTDIRDKICKIAETIVATDQKRVIIYGANELAEIACIVLQEYDLDLIGIIDDEKAGGKILGKTIFKSFFLKNNSFDAIILAHLNSASQEFESLSHFIMQQGTIYTLS